MGLKEDIEIIKETVTTGKKEEKEKKFRFPFGKKVGRSQKKKGYVTVLILNANGVYHFKKYPIEEQTIMHELIPRLATTGHVMFDKKGNPLVILPNWSVEPFSPRKHFTQSQENGSNKKGYQILMAKMKLEQVTGKKSIGKVLPWIIGLAVAGIIGYAVLTGGG